MTNERNRVPDAAILQQLFRDLPLPIAIYSVDGALQHSNDAHQAFADALGDSSGIGMYNALCDLRSERCGHRTPFQRSVAGEVLDYAFAVRPDPAAPAGDTLHFHRLLLPAYDGERRTTNIVSVIVDVSDWQHAERDKARLHAELQQAQRTESLGLLAGSIAHDFNNLLVGVLGNVSLLLTKLEPGSSLRRTAEAIEVAACRAADVARQLLAYAGKGRFRVEELSLSELAREISELMRITLAQRAELRLELPLHIATVKADATQLRQVVMNLVTNARDAVGDGGVITLRAGELPASRVDISSYLGKPDPEATDFVFLDVEDTGQGMDVQTAARIFDPFFTTKPSGRGLGLSAVLGIVRSHGGAMSVQSTPGLGTTMRVLLPAYGHPARNLKLVAAPSLLSSGQLGRVLVIDDDETIRAMLATMLEALGYSVTRASSALEAMHALEHEAKSARCVLLDLNMPQQDGNATFARIRERYPELPVVFVSGYEVRDAPIANGFVHKPFTMNDLREVLSKVLAVPPA
ncbi:MAG: sensor hybrid histidine kinase [Myxococcaceae bacterium]|nr:sensor hybrid histidine kinase [Myxococcaceae bacterium]